MVFSADLSLWTNVHTGLSWDLNTICQSYYSLVKTPSLTPPTNLSSYNKFLPFSSRPLLSHSQLMALLILHRKLSISCPSVSNLCMSVHTHSSLQCQRKKCSYARRVSHPFSRLITLLPPAFSSNWTLLPVPSISI